MKRIIYSLSTTALLALPAVINAQSGFQPDGGEFGDLLTDILRFANDVLIPFIIGIGFLVFVYGMFKYFIAGGQNEDKQKEGKDLMIYATLGFVLIVVFWGVVNLLASSTGLDTANGLDNPPEIKETR
jgi:uncharacterized membrane protein YidH (DUF202 family)